MSLSTSPAWVLRALCGSTDSGSDGSPRCKTDAVAVSLAGPARYCQTTKAAAANRMM